MICGFVGNSGKVCKNERLEGSNFCYKREHYKSENEYNEIYEKHLENFKRDRVSIRKFILIEVNGDGACLYRCLSNGLFRNFGNDLKILRDKFLTTGYFEEDNFLEDYMDIFECFKGNDYLLDDDLEGDIARGLQRLILNYVRINGKKKIMMDMSLEELIFICHDMNLEMYIENYSKFAGDDGEVARWGGIPELKIFSILFGYNINIYVPQKFKKKKFRVVNDNKLDDNSYLKMIENVGSDENINIFNLLLRNYGDGSHYDFLEIVKN